MLAVDLEVFIKYLLIYWNSKNDYPLPVLIFHFKMLYIGLYLEKYTFMKGLKMPNNQRTVFVGKLFPVR